MKRQGGFTLIELVVVIVILGILAVTAAPRFLNLQDDAKNATLEGLRGAMAGAMGISFGKTAIDGIERNQFITGTQENEIDGVQNSFGYPTAVDATGIGAAIDQSGDFVVLSDDGVVGTNATIIYGIDNYAGSCVLYTEATSAAVATVEIVIPGEGTPVAAADACDEE
ncbi:type II secretion system protein [Vibrio splendidus]|uniref:type II secretion system protein n=1 Tax=Vibrio splendidus TaxID=29497 RepID=UPI0007F97EB0|nr:type II secretion system protein [Vibrio splendidus]OBT24526.1 MSHA biogenesis protein MshA [Vibrio splendidus]